MSANNMIAGYTLTNHAQFQIQLRNIQESWIESTLNIPDQTILLADEHGNTHYLKKITEFGDRFLRIVVNPQVEPNRIVTLFFDRRIK
jgi:hypothetical protein